MSVDSARRRLLPDEPGAAGTVGLFRIAFCLLYLWHRASLPEAYLAARSPWMHHRPMGARVLNALGVPEVSPGVLALLLTFSLLVLLVGWKTRWATAAVLVFGGLLELRFSTIIPERAHALPAVLVPLVMLVAGNWGRTHSIDALRTPRSLRVSPHERDGRHLVPVKAILLVLALLFAHSAWLKTLGGGTWLAEPGLLGDIVQYKIIKREIYGYAPFPGMVLFSLEPWLHRPALAGVLAFEVGFSLALLSVGLRRLMTWTALCFHGFNALVLLVSFSAILTLYPAFLPLQPALNRVDAGLRRVTGRGTRRLFGRPARRLRRAPAAAVAAIVLGFAAAGTALWATGTLPAALTLGGTLGWQTIWWVVTPVALVMAAREVWVLSRRLLRRHHAGAATASA